MKSEWAEALQKHLIEKVEPVPAGWKTIKQISKELGKTHGHASKAVTKLMRLGLAEKKLYRALVSNGCGRMIPHYRLLPKAKSP